jgi:iron complex transport system substrate-binding protein
VNVSQFVGAKRSVIVYIALLLVAVLVGACASAAPATEASSEPLTITHALGTTAVPANPQRIVALEWTYVEDLLALGIQPVGVADIAGYHSWVKIPAALSAETVDVGTRQAPNLETLAQLQPDLILAPSFRVAETYEQLQAIAPTITFDPYPTDESITQYDEMRQTLLTIADLTNRRAEGEAVLAAMERTFAAARTEIEAAGKLGEPFVLAQAFGDDTVQVRLFTDNAMAVEIVEQIGLENAWEESEFQPYGFTTVSVETLPELDNANFFYVVQDDNNVFGRDAIKPVWESLEFVRNDRAYPLGGDTWLFGGPLSAQVVVETVLASLGLEAAQTGAPAAAAFPVTIKHKFGSTEIAQKPQRVISLGYSDQDAILALGTQPIAVRYWFGDAERQVWPWAEGKLTGGQPAVLNMPFGELNFEAIAALQPDLIIAVSAGISDQEYATLSQIAPTVAQSAEYVDFGVPWQEQTVVIGQALGEEALARQLVEEAEARFAQLREQHPELNGATAAITAPAGEGQFYFSGPQHERQRFLTSLGFVLPEALVEIAGDAFYGTISGERLDLFDTDVLIWTVYSAEERAEIEANPLYQQLEVAQRAIFLDTSGAGELAGPALVFSSVLSLPLLFDEFVPQLAEHVNSGASR